MGRRGYKTCPKCNTEVGVRTRTCKCGTVFISKKVSDECNKQSRIESFKHLAATGVKVLPFKPKAVDLGAAALVGAPPAFKPKARVGPPAFKPKAAIHEAPEFQVVRLTDRTMVQRFIADLKEALKGSINTGGSYSAFVHPVLAHKTLQVEVHVK